MGCLREQTERIEQTILSEHAVLSANSQGRSVPEPECDVRTVFQRDRDRILHSKAFRRLKGKTQVFISPEGDHYRTRLTHTLEVSQISRTIARALRLNEDLTEAITLGHDLGHTPFGHAGEAALNKVYEQGFQHNRQSLRVVEKLERYKPGVEGLNLTFEVRDGILNHTGSQLPVTLEGQIVKIADRIAYINHDIDDAIRAGLLTETALPQDAISVLGEDRPRRIDTLVRDLIHSSEGQPQIQMSSGIWEAMMTLRTFLFKNVYIGSAAKIEESKVGRMLRTLYDYYLEYPENLPEEWHRDDADGLERWIIDYIAGMTDRYAIHEYTKLFLPKAWSI